jgi:prepilin-type N-terminal cleavage/methylation domain-containing protein
MKRPKRSAPEAGFTFIELMAVLILASIALVYVVLNLDGLTSESRLAAAGRQLGSTVSWIRGEAAAQARDLIIEFDLDNARYRIVVPPRPGLHRSRAQEEWDVLSWTLLPDAVRITDMEFPAYKTNRAREDVVTRGVRSVRFAANGTTQTFLVHLESSEILDREYKMFSIEVNGFTGAVTAEHGRREFAATRESSEMN